MPPMVNYNFDWLKMMYWAAALIKSKIRWLSFEGFIFGACHESQFDQENDNVIDVVELTEAYLFLSFHNTEITSTDISLVLTVHTVQCSVVISTDNVCCIWINNPCESNICTVSWEIYMQCFQYTFQLK